MEPCYNTDSIDYGNHYFELVGEAYTLEKIGLQFIGVVNTATNCFRINYFSDVYLNYISDRSILINKDADWLPSILAFTCIEYFIASC